ncbi:MAG: GNAT family N-acetyltransferase [Proteobacteria bacterium]|nr:GNAT family N-acetyltransferase [Pseudomonadota bacterium]
MKNSFSPTSPASTEDESRHVLRNGTIIVVRPIRAADVELERNFIERLSPESRRARFLAAVKTPSRELLKQLTQPQLTGGIAYVALVGQGVATQEIGVARYSSSADPRACECAVVVSDEWQGLGIATLLMHKLIDTARANGFQRMYSIDATGNQEMRELGAHLGFKCSPDHEDPTLVIHTLTLQPAPAGASAA